eukprot:8110563-Pyramimonas_sp.AAC.1
MVRAPVPRDADEIDEKLHVALEQHDLAEVTVGQVLAAPAVTDNIVAFPVVARELPSPKILEAPYDSLP